MEFNRYQLENNTTALNHILIEKTANDTRFFIILSTSSKKNALVI
jgi:hypothetical protein